MLDEPTSGLDTMVRRVFLESMVDIAAEGRTVLLSSHQIGEVERVADIVAIVHAGRLVAVERLDQLKQSTRQLTVTVSDANALLPTITVLAVDIGILIGGIVVVESVFAYPGLGRMLIYSIDNQDLPLLMGGRRPGVRMPLPRVGEHTEEILAALRPKLHAA